MFETDKKVRCSNCGNCRNFESNFMHRECGFKYKCMICNQIWIEGAFSMILVQKGDDKIEENNKLGPYGDWPVDGH